MLNAVEVGYRVVEPLGVETPLVVEIPHASIALDPESIATLTAPARCVGQDADLYVDELYADAAELGATVLVAEVSRYVCDLNRAETDIDAAAVSSAPKDAPALPHGLIWRRSTDGQAVLAKPLDDQEFQRRMVRYYRPYHQTLSDMVEAKRARFGFALVLAAHSMPSSGRVGHLDSGNDRADVVPGSRGGTTAQAEMIRIPEELAQRRNWSVVHDQPYRGGFTTGFWGQPQRQIHAVQVELNRRLYMDELTLSRRPGGFEQTRQYCRELVQALSRFRPASA